LSYSTQFRGEVKQRQAVFGTVSVCKRY